MTTVVILAAGKQTRWERNMGAGTRKQLLDVGGETILSRMIRQCNDRGAVPIAMTIHKEIKEAIRFEDRATWMTPRFYEYTVSTFQSAPWGEKRTIVLLGDVVYSKTVMNRIFECAAPIKVFGSIYEIFAVSMSARVYRGVQDACTAAYEHALLGGKGTMRKFYQAYCGLDLGGDAMETKVLDPVCWIADYTRDVDTPEDYRDLRIKVVNGGLLDDLKGGQDALA